VGAHVGTFALAALRAGASVHCFEPDADNFRLLEHNLRPFAGRARLRRAAVWRSDAPAARLSLHNPLAARNTGAHQVSTLGVGAAVEAVAFDDVIDGLTAGGGRVRLVKLDCEGAEWPILLTSRRLGRIDAVCGEYHLGPLPAAFGVAGCPGFGPDLLRQALAGQGFRAWTVPLRPVPHPCGLFFARRE
jgi:FkbM family methyltransferase